MLSLLSRFACFTAAMLACYLEARPRLVSTSPQVTETLFQLGKGADLVATSHFSDYPDAAKALPRIGPVFAAGVESLVKFSPDWVISDAEASPITLEKGLDASGIPHFAMKVNSVAALFDQSAMVLKKIYGTAANVPLDQFRACADRFPKTPTAYSFLAFAWLSPPILFGHASFLSDVISRTGGKNQLPKAWQMPFPKVSLEWILKQEISTVFYLAQSKETAAEAETLAAKWWPGKKIRMVGLNPDRFARGSFTPLQHASEIVAGTVPAGCGP